MSSLKNKFAIVTGASTPKGIGNAISKRFAEAGASVFLVAEGTVAQLETKTRVAIRLEARDTRNGWKLKAA